MNRIETLLFYVVRYSAVLLPLIAFAGICFGGIFSYSAFFIVFVFYFIIEIILWATKIGAYSTKENEFYFVDPKNKKSIDEVSVYTYSLMHILLVPLALYVLTQRNFDSYFFGAMLSMAATLGTVGGLVGHEFMHRKNFFEQQLGVLVYSVVNYGHFRVSHLYGHHVTVGTYGDWSTSRKNESYYSFWNRAVFDGYIAAWKLESKRLVKKGIPLFSLKNEMLRTSLLQILINLCVLAVFGLSMLLAYWVVCFMALSLMEIVNYLSHYGLVRGVNENGSLEQIQNKHSWESHSKVTNWFIFNAGKHCHHHTRPTGHHDDLMLCHEKDYLPFGLPMMALIALVPPLYFRLMNPRLKRALQENLVNEPTGIEALNVCKI